METAVVMKRELFGYNISQNSKTEMFSSTDLVKAGNKWRAMNGHDQFLSKSWFANKSTKEFISELEEKYGKGNVIKRARGKGTHTWVHPLLFIDMALAISPQLKIEVYEWLFDHLIKFRNESGDSYKEMCGYLYARTTRKTSFPHFIQEVATKIRKACGVEDWQLATQEQLEARKKLQNDIALLADVLNNADEAVDLAIKKFKGW